MNRDDIDNLIQKGSFPCACNQPELQETHISWIILCDQDVFKIKKPIHYDFLDFSTPEQRKYFCQEEVRLNNRLTQGIYLGVVTVSRLQDRFAIGTSMGKTIDFAVHMKRLPDQRRMDLLLTRGMVEDQDIFAIADQLITFHSKTTRFDNQDTEGLLVKVNAIQQHEQYVTQKLGEEYGIIIRQMIDLNTRFLNENHLMLQERGHSGFVRDCHGDLHSRNIFLAERPIIFDCIEFNPDYRRIDLLNEIAFFCMDLESFGCRELAEVFLEYYNTNYPICRNEKEYALFVFYKAYRANVRAKVNLLRAISDAHNDAYLGEAARYLDLMQGYSKELGAINER